MSSKLFQLNIQLHRNPSRDKIRCHSIKSSRSTIKKQGGGQKSIVSHTRADSSDDKFLKKCFENVYLQNIILNEEISRKNKQYTMLNYEHERLKKLNDVNLRIQDNIIENRLNRSSSRSSINSSLMTQKLAPVEQIKNKDKFYFLLKDTLQELTQRKIAIDKKNK